MLFDNLVSEHEEWFEKHLEIVEEFECVKNFYGKSFDDLKFEIKKCDGGAFKVIRGKK